MNLKWSIQTKIKKRLKSHADKIRMAPLPRLRGGTKSGTYFWCAMSIGQLRQDPECMHELSYIQSYYLLGALGKLKKYRVQNWVLSRFSARAVPCLYPSIEDHRRNYEPALGHWATAYLLIGNSFREALNVRVHY